MGASTPNDEESARQCWGNKQICAIKEETQNPLFIHKTTDEQFDIWRELRNIAQVAADEADARVSALTRKVETYDGYVEDDKDDISNINGRLVHADVDLRLAESSTGPKDEARISNIKAFISHYEDQCSKTLSDLDKERQGIGGIAGGDLRIRAGQGFRRRGADGIEHRSPHASGTTTRRAEA